MAQRGQLPSDAAFAIHVTRLVRKNDHEIQGGSTTCFKLENPYL